MNAVPLDPSLPLQFFEGILWAIVWAVFVLCCAEVLCVVALWVLDGKQGSAVRPTIMEQYGRIPTPSGGVMENTLTEVEAGK